MLLHFSHIRFYFGLGMPKRVRRSQSALRLMPRRRASSVSESAPWARARDSNPWSNRVRAFMRHDVGSPGVYRRLYPK